MTLRPPDGLWSVKVTLLLLTALMGPTLAALALVHDDAFTTNLAAACTIIVGSGALLGAGLLIAHARLAGNDQSLWLATVLGVLAATGLARGGYGLVHPDALRLQSPTVLVGLVGLTALLAVVLLCAPRWGSEVNPLAVGVPLGVALLVLQHVVITDAPHVEQELLPVLAALLCLSVLALAATVQRLGALPYWARERFSVSLVLGVTSWALLLVPIPIGTRAVVAAGAGLSGALLLATTAAALLREVITDGQRQLTDLQRRLAAAEEARRADSARLHDINSLVAGIASASRLLGELPPSEQRAGLELLILAELERLQRLMADRSAKPGRAPGRIRRASRAASAGTTFDVGEVAARIALAHRARGRDVRWQVGNARAAGDPDDLATILDILIDNAATHGSADDITVGVRRVGAQVEITVSDGGSGVPDELRQSLFDWGTRGAESDGSGIGLASAVALAAGLGGRLQLDGSVPGTRMVLSLPAHVSSAVPEDLAVAGL